MTIKERIIEVLKHFEVGLTYNNLLEQYKGEYNEELLWGYEHIKQLRDKNIIESYKSKNTKGKALTYRLIATEESESLENQIDKEIIETFLKSKTFQKSEEDLPFNNNHQERIKQIWSKRKNG